MNDKLQSIKTSWSDEQLDKLCVASNHRISYDGYEYVWEHKINGNSWEVHCITRYEDYTTLYSFLKFWLHMYKVEAKQRKDKQEKKILKDIRELLKMSETYKTISDRKDLSTKEKIELMDRSYKIKDIDMVSKILKISHTLIRKHLREL